MPSLHLDSTYAPTGGSGVLRLRLVNAGAVPCTGFRLVFNAFQHYTPAAGAACRLVSRVGTCHDLEPTDTTTLASGDTWESGPLDCEYPLFHANDGPESAYIACDDGSTVAVHVVPTERATVRIGDQAPPRLSLADPTDLSAGAWAVAASCEQRLYSDDDHVLSGEPGGTTVSATIDGSLGAESFRIEPESTTQPDDPGWRVAAGSVTGLQWGIMELARRLRGDSSLTATTSTPRYPFRGLMVDVARHWFPAADIEEVIDLAGWRRVNRLHLHLTDDQGWRVPIEGYPALTEVGAWRGHGMPVPPLNRSGADPYGGSYTVDEIRRWVARAQELGVELIPEIDVPGHCFAAIAAVPELRDPDDTGTVESPHHFPRNVLNPGLPETRRFLETVFGEVADLFPGRWIHVGCDEVAHGAWEHSPAARSYAAERGLDSHREIERSFVAEIVELVKVNTGREIGAWEEAATIGGLRPGDGYVVGWTNNEACRRMAEEGYSVVSSPGEQYYLDMAQGEDWHLPGMWWGGVIDNDTLATFDATAGLDDTVAGHVTGIQACLWGEHVADRATMRAMLLPRLDAFGDCGWHG